MEKSISKTLIIGLGGTGQSVICDIKKRLYRRYGEIPVMVKFLSFDTDVVDYHDASFMYNYEGESFSTKRYNVQRDEFCQLPRPDLNVLRTDQNCQNLNFKALEESYRAANTVGTGGSRVLGRACLLYNAGMVMNILNRAVSELKNVQLNSSQVAQGYSMPNNAIKVYVVASLAGGTGSSMIMDFSRMLQHAGVNSLSVLEESSADSIVGMFFLPSFFVDYPDAQMVQVNAYAALSELDHTLDLGNTQKYPDGCPEREADVNVYSGYNSYREVRYSNVFLIDSKTKNGRSHTFADACGCVASFIAASLASNNPMSSAHALYDVKGKRQYYSGMGYSEISFSRQLFVNYCFAKQMRSLLDQYYFDNIVNLDELVDSYVNANGLNEGWKDVVTGIDDRAQLNQLTDAIFKLDDSEFSSIKMEIPASGAKVLEDIEQYGRDYLEELGEVVKLRIGQFQNQKQQPLCDRLVAFLELHQKNKGFGRFPELAKRLVRSITRMKEGLEDEMTYILGRKHEMEDGLKSLASSISNYSSKGFLGIGNQEENQKRHIELYRMKVEGVGTEQEPTLARLELDMARKKKAVQVYEQLVGIIREYYDEKPMEADNGETVLEVHGKSVEVRRGFDNLKLMLEQDIDSYKPSTESSFETVFIDAYLKPYFDAHLADVFGITETIQKTFDERVAVVFENKDGVDREILNGLRNDLLSLLPEDSAIKMIHNNLLSMDELFLRCFGKASNIDDDWDVESYPQLKLFNRMESILEPLWVWDDFSGEHSMRVHSICFVGVFDTGCHIFNKENGYEVYLPKLHFYHYENLGDPDRIGFMLFENAIPAFKLKDVDVWASEYKKRKKSTYVFSDKRLEHIAMLTDFE